jgi:hypothetical protein
MRPQIGPASEYRLPSRYDGMSEGNAGPLTRGPLTQELHPVRSRSGRPDNGWGVPTAPQAGLAPVGQSTPFSGTRQTQGEPYSAKVLGTSYR